MSATRSTCTTRGARERSLGLADWIGAPPQPDPVHLRLRKLPSPMGILDGRVACITGGTRGIGRGIAEAFLAEGANVVINGRDPARHHDQRILPGLIETDILRATGPASAVAMGVESYDALLDLFAQESAIKRLNTVEEVGAVAVLLASDAAGNMTGCLFPVDGGTMPYQWAPKRRRVSLTLDGTLSCSLRRERSGTGRASLRGER